MGKKIESELQPIRKYRANFHCKADIIFVHGLGGDYIKTWSSKDRPKYYFPELLQEDLPDVRIWSLDYPAHMTNWTEKGAYMSLLDRADNVINLLRTEKIGEFPIIFICHSLGGLLVKKILRRSNDKGNASEIEKSIKKVLKQTKGVCFIATPHRGSNLANIAKYINKLFRFTKLVKALKANAPELMELDTWYRENSGKFGINTLAFGENIKTSRLWVSKFWVVDEVGSNPNVGNFSKLNYNHEMICKPTESKKSPIYIRVKSFVDEVLKISSYQPGVLDEEVSRYLKRLDSDIERKFPKPSVDFDITYTSSDQPYSELNFKSVLETLDDQKKIILEGSAGGGKSIILRKIAKYFIDIKHPPIFINLKNWRAEKNNDQLKRLTKSEPDIDNTKKKFDILLRAALGDVDIVFLNSYPKVFNVILIDGLNEISGNVIINEIISTLEEYKRKYSREVRIIMSTRDSRGLRYVDDWAVISVNKISENEVERQIKNKFDPSKYENLSTHSKELLRIPFFLNNAIKQKNLELGYAAKAIESFFRFHNKFIDDRILDDLSKIAFKIYEEIRGLSFGEDDFIDEKDSEEQKEKKGKWFEKLKGSGIIKEVEESVYAFDHQLYHDYLVARYIAQYEELWGDEEFDIASFQSNSFDAISLTLEQIHDVSKGDTFLKKVYNWNWVATLDCLIKNLSVKNELFSNDLKVAIKAIIAEKLSDPIKGTRETTKKKLEYFPKDDEPNFSHIKYLDSILNFIQSFEYEQEWFEDWKSIYLKAPKRTGYNTLEENDIKKIISEDSVLGWTASNVIRRFTLSEAKQCQLRKYFERYSINDFKDSTNNSIRWRIVHALGRSPSKENSSLFSGILKAEDEYFWVKYGAARSLVEIAALSHDMNFRREIFDDLKHIIQTVKSLPTKVIQEIVKPIFYKDINGEWAPIVRPLLECIIEKYRNNKEEHMFKKKLSDFETFIKENKKGE
ncbi:MAG: alpha/beta hydrolase [Candidatus Aminicenantes bacterium]|jgi:hypothetical protein